MPVFCLRYVGHTVCWVRLLSGSSHVVWCHHKTAVNSKLTVSYFVKIKQFCNPPMLLQNKDRRVGCGGKIIEPVAQFQRIIQRRRTCREGLRLITVQALMAWDLLLILWPLELVTRCKQRLQKPGSLNTKAVSTVQLVSKFIVQNKDVRPTAVSFYRLDCITWGLTEA